MSNSIVISNANELLEQMRCSLCKSYLSGSPVHMLPDGSCVCRCCNPPKLFPAIRALPLEILLSKFSFPCRFKERGCPERILFDENTDHESECSYRSFACPSLNACVWEGPTTEIYDHVRQQHPELVKESATFKLNLNQDANEVFIVVKDHVVFTIKYSYNVYESCFKYDVRFFVNARKDEGMFMIQLINDADPNCNFNLKCSKCLVYDNSFYNMQNAAVLNLGRYLEILDNPTCIAVVMNLKVIKLCNDSNVVAEAKIVDYELLESIRCKQCKNYLIPPLFDWDGTTICCNCAKRYSMSPPTSNAELVKLVSEINYPCRWRNCSYVGNSDNIQMHTLSCQFRHYQCFVLNCRASISVNTAAEHLLSHKNCEYLSGGTFKVIFSSYYSPRFVWTIKNDTLIAIQHYTIGSTYGNCVHVESQVVCLMPDAILGKFTVNIQFEHQHCNLKSELFVLSSNNVKYIKLEQLPVCFAKSDELSVTISACK